MQTVHRSVLVPYSAQQMFDLVDDVQHYCEFLPWCGGSKVIAETANGKVARVDISFKGVSAHFTTNNVNVPPESITIALEEGPFKALKGKWSFKSLAPDACKVEFDLSYEFKTTVSTLTPLFGSVTETLAGIPKRFLY